MSKVSDHIKEFVPVTLFLTDPLGSWYKEIESVEYLSSLIEEESKYWFAGDVREECENGLIDIYNKMISNSLKSNSIKIRDTTYRFSID